VHAVAPGDFAFRTDPYEYERRRPAIDILSGSDRFRKAVLEGAPLAEMREEWKRERGSFFDLFRSFSRYAEDRP
jgi:hypothetical protein